MNISKIFHKIIKQISLHRTLVYNTKLAKLARLQSLSGGDAGRWNLWLEIRGMIFHGRNQFPIVR